MKEYIGRMVTEVFVTLLFVFIFVRWYFEHKYGRKIESLLDRIEDLIIEKHRSKKDIVGLLATVGEQSVEIATKNERIEELESTIVSLQKRYSEKPVRTKRLRGDSD